MSRPNPPISPTFRPVLDPTRLKGPARRRYRQVLQQYSRMLFYLGTVVRIYVQAARRIDTAVAMGEVMTPTHPWVQIYANCWREAERRSRILVDSADTIDNAPVICQRADRITTVGMTYVSTFTRIHRRMCKRYDFIEDTM